ncbi:MAG TPA: hypothetical protein VFD53_05590, partial [Ilumatobacter sp.]|nr:hypothetical protein [Ilumatobacter sp.]
MAGWNHEHAFGVKNRCSGNSADTSLRWASLGVAPFDSAEFQNFLDGRARKLALLGTASCPGSEQRQRYAQPMSTPSVEPRHLRSALQFAVDIAREGQKRKPPIKYPAGLKRYLQMPRLPKEALPAVRRIVETDDAFRTLIAKAATPELVDAVGLVWLSRQEGWEAELGRLAAAADAEAVEADKALALKRAEKRLVAAEQAAARARVEV